jgi:Fe(3+) dicitrate transport protein
MLTHLIKPTKNFSIVTKAYKTNSRNWYKLDALKLGSSKVSINNILTNPTTYNAERAISGADTQ